MTDLRARLAEMLALEDTYETEDANNIKRHHFLSDPALARALEDAERVPALEAQIRELQATAKD